MPLYTGIGGVRKEITEMSCGISGVKRDMSEMWAGINGIKRQIFSSGLPDGTEVYVTFSGITICGKLTVASVTVQGQKYIHPGRYVTFVGNFFEVRLYIGLFLNSVYSNGYIYVDGVLKDYVKGVGNDLSQIYVSVPVKNNVSVEVRAIDSNSLGAYVTTEKS